MLWGELDRETQEFGLATTGGIVTDTGIAGLTLGGGIGWLQRKHGLTIDRLLSVDLITADGQFVKASGDPLGPIVLAGPIIWPIEESPEVLRFYRDWIAEAPDELMTIVVQRKLLPLPFVPPELHGELVLSVGCCYTGPVEKGEDVVRPLREFGNPVLDLCEPKPYLVQRSSGNPRSSRRGGARTRSTRVAPIRLAAPW